MVRNAMLQVRENLVGRDLCIRSILLKPRSRMMKLEGTNHDWGCDYGYKIDRRRYNHLAKCLWL